MRLRRVIGVSRSGARQTGVPGRRIWRLLVSTCVQPGGQPVVDFGLSTDDDGWSYRVLVVRLSATPGRAVVLGWRFEGAFTSPRPTHPRVLFRPRP